MASSNVTGLIKPPIYIIVSIVLFSLNKLAEIMEYPLHDFITSYLDDLLFMPVCLWITQTTIRLIKHPFFQFSLLQSIIVLIYISILFEYLIPKWKPYFISDPLDILMYTFGMLIFLLLNRKQTPSQENNY